MACAADRSFFAPPGISSSSKGVQLADLAGVLLTDGASPVDQQPQHLELFVADHWPQPTHPGPDQGHGVGVGGVGLAALAGGEDPGPCRELRRHVDDLLAVGQQSHRDVPANAVAALDRPDPVRPADHRGQHRAVARGVGGEPVTADHGLIGGHHLDGDRPPVRVRPDHDPLLILRHRCPPARRSEVVGGPGGHRCLEQSNPFLSHSRPAVPGVAQANSEPHPEGGQPN